MRTIFTTSELYFDITIRHTDNIGLNSMNVGVTCNFVDVKRSKFTPIYSFILWLKQRFPYSKSVHSKLNLLHKHC